MNKNPKQVKAEVLEDSSIYEIRESGLSHTPFSLEYQLFTAIRDGNEKLVTESIDRYFESGLVIGKMSNNSIKEARYFAVAAIATATHYAILGGLDETTAYSMSDTYIRYIDNLQTISECVFYLKERALELTDAVKNSSNTKDYPVHIAACLHYVQNHLHERLRIEDIAGALGLSRDHLSRLFSKTIGTPLHQYILNEKIKEARSLLIQGYPIDKISYTLCFSSESHFINSFRKFYGVTPKAYLKQPFQSDN